jgi:hypothetical protein
VEALFKDGKYFEEMTKSGKIMGSRESLSKDFSNKYQCYRVSIASKIFIIFFIF